MDLKRIETGGIGWIAPVEGSARWYWGGAPVSGDLYEAQELFEAGSEIKSNRVVFVSYPDGAVFEPLIAQAGQYFGTPVCCDDVLYLLLVDFPAGQIRIYAWTPEGEGAAVELHAQLPLSDVRNCYNLQLAVKPLALLRQGGYGDFQVLWPDKGDFEIGDHESFDYREGDVLVFAEWFEDPDYREEVVLREYPSGRFIMRFDGSTREMPDGSHWLLN